MSSAWPALSYEAWSETCDTLHAHTQVLGKLAVELAPPEPELQHAALNLTPRGWETDALPAPDRSGSLVAGLNLHTHEAFVEHSGYQCGFCTSGQIMSSKALLDRVPNPTEDQVRTALAGNLCRCSAYKKILESVMAASRLTRV